MTKKMRRTRIVVVVSLGLVLMLMVIIYCCLPSYPSYPYGRSHCCLKILGLALIQYAQQNDGHYPAGGNSPEASLSLLHKHPYDTDAETLRGKTVPVELVYAILERGELLSPDSCGWNYVEGLTTSDNGELALVWDKVGLGHNGEDLNGGHSVWRLGGWEEIVPAAEWPEFLLQQAKLLAQRHPPAEPEAIHEPQINQNAK